jgi:hypothetical protein
VLKQMAARTMSDPSGDPLTGAELGMAGGQAMNGTGTTGNTL